MAVLLQQIPSYPLGGSTRNKYANVKSRVDQSDPNPAHKLQNSVKDLTIDSEQGRQINPRFSNRFAPSPSALIQRRKTTDFNDRFPLSTCHKKNPQAKTHLQKSQSVDSHFSRKQPRSPDCTFPLGKNQRMHRMTSLEHKRFSHSLPTFETIEEDETGVADSSEASKVAKPEAFSASVEDSVPVFSQTGSDEDDDESVGIAGMEITNSGTETTVVLQHILALASSRSSSNTSNSGAKRASPPTSPRHSSISDMAIIEEDEMEDEDEYFESPDTPMTPVTPVTLATPDAQMYTLPHPIPRLIVTDENVELVETVVENSTVFPGYIIPSSSSPSIPPSRPSNTLPPTVEEEDELESCYLSTRL